MVNHNRSKHAKQRSKLNADDSSGIWEHGFDELNKIHELSNSLHLWHSYRAALHNWKNIFLDLFVNIENGELNTDFYTKLTDKHQYLHVSSKHSNSVKNAIPYWLGINIKRICSTEENYKIKREEIKSHLLKQGYNKSSTEDQLKNVGTIYYDTNQRTKTTGNPWLLLIPKRFQIYIQYSERKISNRSAYRSLQTRHQHKRYLSVQAAQFIILWEKKQLMAVDHAEKIVHYAHKLAIPRYFVIPSEKNTSYSNK